MRAVLARVDALAAAVPQVEPLAAQDVGQAVRLLRAACHRGLALLDGGIDRPDARRTLMIEMDALMGAHAQVWRLHNREGGLRDSLARLACIRDEYR